MKFKELDKRPVEEVEQSILDSWGGIMGIMNRQNEERRDAKPFVFYDGPAFANGFPGLHHMVAKNLKDAICKYHVMKGEKVIRKVGWDTHGLPVENHVEKKLGISSKKEIEELGVAKFNEECRSSVRENEAAFTNLTSLMGQFIDVDHPYLTYKNEYIETEWWILKKFYEEGLFYEGTRVVPYCPHCGTGLATHEVAQDYQSDDTDTVYVPFKIKGQDVYFLVWTTTPWTLLANVALCVNPNEEYVKVESKGNQFILAKALVSTVIGDDVTVLETYKGKDLEYTEYEQLIPSLQVEGKAFYVTCDTYVTMEDGTGIVHMAPAFGADDANVCERYGIAGLNPVGKDGCYTEGPWKGTFVFDANLDIIKYLKENGKLFKKQRIKHDYPHCWRCHTPLIYYSMPSYYIKVSAFKDKLVKANSKVHWYPSYVGEKRFANWLENAKDWNVSRSRYWGSPIPYWTCSCGHAEMIGSIEELKSRAIEKVSDDLDLHKPYIDEIHLKCPKCGKEMSRIPDVLDCWFDSGSMPFAQWHYPFENKEIFEANFPAQFISEAIDQTRGWFYTLLAVSTCLFDKSSYENCIVLGHVLDDKGQKMSKSKKNGVDPFELLDTVGADATRWHFYTCSAPWIPTRLSVKSVQETQRKFLSTLWNVYSFYVLYAEIDQFNPLNYKDFKVTNVMDKWILSKMYTLIKEVDAKLDKYDITGAALLIEDFTDELSNWYVRRNRERFWASGMEDDKVGAYVTLYNVLVNLVKVAAPFVPFITDEIYQNLVVNLDKEAPESVHLCLWPEVNEAEIDKDLEKEMDLAYKIVKLGRSARNAANIKNRQPLSEMLISVGTLPEYYGDIVKDELNVKEVVLGADMSKYVDFEIKPNLPVLGKEYGKLIPKIREAISKLNQMDLANKVKNGGVEYIEVEDEQIPLDESNLLVTMQGKEGYAFAGEGELGVVLETTITPELKEEGYLREILSKVQNMRKDRDFEVLDRINLYFANCDTLKDVIEKYKEQIMKDTLADNIFYNEKRDNYVETKINDEKIDIDVEVVK